MQLPLINNLVGGLGESSSYNLGWGASREMSKVNCSPPPTGRLPSQSLKSSHHGKQNTSCLSTCCWHLPLPLFFFFFLTVALHSMEYPFGHFRSDVPAVPPTWCFAHHQPIHCRGSKVRKRAALMLSKHCASVAKTLVCYQCCCSHRSKSHMGC